MPMEIVWNVAEVEFKILLKDFLFKNSDLKIKFFNGPKHEDEREAFGA